GLLFLAEARAIKAKRPATWRERLPSLEALDRVNAATLAARFPLASCAAFAGAVYGALVVARFGAGWRGREAAASAAIGFAFLLFVMVGVGAIAWGCCWSAWTTAAPPS